MIDRTRLGAFARIFRRDSAGELADAFVDHGLRQVQLNLGALGLPTIPGPGDVDDEELISIAAAFRSRDTTLWGVSATYNTAHPDAGRRTGDTARAAGFIARLGATGAVAATLCSGSRDPHDMWARHPDTATEDAWHDFRASLDMLLPAAEKAGIVLGIEPEPANTVSDVDRALRLQRELGTDAALVGFILDPANLISDAAPQDRAATLERAFAELGSRTICVHAKDVVPWSRTLEGAGVVDYAQVERLFALLPTSVPLIIQDATETELARVISLVESPSTGAR